MPTDKKTPKVKIANLKPTKESKEAIFIRLAKPRVKNVLRALRILGNCSNRSNYAYTQEQITQIFERISNSLLECENKFSKSKIQLEAFEFL